MLTLDANPHDAPGCVKLTSETGATVLFQTDYDWPSVAGLFGWTPKRCQPKAPEGYSDWEEGRDKLEFDESVYQKWADRKDCEHPNTDGTVDCKLCKTTSITFITHARQWIDDHDGETCENPGYELE